jgi:hypothetical protein
MEIVTVEEMEIADVLSSITTIFMSNGVTGMITIGRMFRAICSETSGPFAATIGGDLTAAVLYSVGRTPVADG